MVTTALERPKRHPEEPTAARRGEGARIERLVRENLESLWRLARRWGLTSADADDVAQRTLMIANQRLDEIVEGHERAFLFKTTLFLASKVHRTRRRKPETHIEDVDEVMDPELDPEELLEQYRARARLDAILSEMPEPLRAVFVLFELEDLSQLEIAETLGIPQGTVASRLRRARELFMRMMSSTIGAHLKSGALP